MTYPKKDKLTVEHKPSETAMGAATLRAIAVMDKRKEVKGSDWLAELFLTEDHKNTLKDPAVREQIIRNRIVPGMYEFMIARTAFFDHVVEKALRENIPQVVFLGAGYDSRPYRFKDLIKDTRIFELDIRPTQHRKKELLHRAGIAIPDQVIFVAINFNTDNIGDVLNLAGFNRNEKTLFVWEGVTYYLPAKIVDDTLLVIKSSSSAGSLICFDYASRSYEISNDEGVKKIREMMRSNYPGEPTQFGIKSGEVESFLTARGYHIIEHLTSKDMERKYLKLPDGSLAGEVPVLFCLILASVSDHTIVNDINK